MKWRVQYNATFFVLSKITIIGAKSLIFYVSVFFQTPAQLSLLFVSSLASSRAPQLPNVRVLSGIEHYYRMKLVNAFLFIEDIQRNKKKRVTVKTIRATTTYLRAMFHSLQPDILIQLLLSKGSKVRQNWSCQNIYRSYQCIFRTHQLAI